MARRAPKKKQKPVSVLGPLLEKQRARRAEQQGIATSRRLQAEAVLDVSQRLVASMTAGIREQRVNGFLKARFADAMKIAAKRETEGDVVAVAIALILEEQTQRVGRYLADQAQEWRDVSSAAAGAAHELGGAIAELERLG